MRANGIQGAKRRGKPWRTTIPDLDALRRPDLVGRDFTAKELNRLWVGDLSYLRCWEGVVYFAFVIDVYSRRVIGWQLASHMRTDLVLDALRMALGTREHGAEFGSLRTPIEAANTRRPLTRRSSTTTTSWRRSARSATPTTTPWPSHSSIRLRPS
jgi:transposase InsO family protein